MARRIEMPTKGPAAVMREADTWISPNIPHLFEKHSITPPEPNSNEKQSVKSPDAQYDLINVESDKSENVAEPRRLARMHNAPKRYDEEY